MYSAQSLGFVWNKCIAYVCFIFVTNYNIQGAWCAYILCHRISKFAVWVMYNKKKKIQGFWVGHCFERCVLTFRVEL